MFAVGDLRHGGVKRVASAVGEGSAVVRQILEYLEDEPAGAVVWEAATPAQGSPGMMTAGAPAQGPDRRGHVSSDPPTTGSSIVQLDQPRVGGTASDDTSDVYALMIRGWAIGNGATGYRTSSSCTAAQVLRDGAALRDEGRIAAQRQLP